jgi:hypothetical protein
MTFEAKEIPLSITILGLILFNLGFTFGFQKQKQNLNPIALVSESHSPTPTSPPNIEATLIPTLTQSPTPSPIPAPKIIFGIGSQAGPAMDYKLVKEAPVHMLTSWYNGPKDLEWMRVQQNDLIPRLYKKKYIVHLITWTDLPEVEIQTPYGPACGRPYPVSTQILNDTKQLAEIYNGPGAMYVTLFTEFGTFTCTDNNWIGNENYYKTLIDNYIKIVDIFHTYAPHSKVALSWGGWISRYDDKVNQGGQSLIPHFANAIAKSDFTAFQTMESDTNISDILEMTHLLGAYKKPVMLSHYKPTNNSQKVMDNDMKKLFTDEIMSKLIKSGLFAISLMDSEQIDNSDVTYQLVKNGIQKYGK